MYKQKNHVSNKIYLEIYLKIAYYFIYTDNVIIIHNSILDRYTDIMVFTKATWKYFSSIQYYVRAAMTASEERLQEAMEKVAIVAKSK